jgi:hypothetical protein
MYPIFRYAGLRLNESPETSSQIKKALERLMIKPVAAGLPRYGPMLNHASACEGNEKKIHPLSAHRVTQSIRGVTGQSAK